MQTNNIIILTNNNFASKEKKVIKDQKIIIKILKIFYFCITNQILQDINYISVKQQNFANKIIQIIFF